MALADEDRALLEFERKWEASTPGAKNSSIRARFGWGAARYYQRLYVILDSPEALKADPMLVRRLIRLRDQRRRAREARTFRLVDSL